MFKLGPGHINWPLVAGALIVTLVSVVAVFGPQIAPHDPLDEVSIIKDGDAWLTPPFPAFQVKDYPLGSDIFGRDLLSRLLYGLRPTLVMVMTVAGIRLILGVGIGLMSGWYENWFGQWLTALTSTALSVPVLIVALISIAAIGVEFGIWAFIVGLCVTGWAESAQVTREKTRSLKSEQYIEAGHAVGATSAQILFGHVLRHVAPMVWMLFSFEISNTLMVTASLGFLGYFIGGDVWIEIGDFVARRISGAPELGQMLATSWSSILEPWGMFSVGTVIFVTVLGFNFLGEGLRRRLAYQRDAEQSIYGFILSKMLPQLRSTVIRPVSRWMTAHPYLSASIVLAFLALATPLLLWRVGAAVEDKATLNMPEHIWASEWHDPYGTMQTKVTGPVKPDVLWTFETAGQIEGGIAINEEGQLYIGDSTGALYAIDRDGQLVWEYDIANAIVGSPAIGAAGSIYVSDEFANLYAISPLGETLWRYVSEIQRKPGSGPVVGVDGTIYSGFGSNLMALTPKGELKWHIAIPYGQYQNPPRLSIGGKWLFLDSLVIDVVNGTRIAWPTMQEMDMTLAGLDGRHYARSGNLVMMWESLEDDIAIVESAKWDSSSFTFYKPRYTGITKDGIIWMTYTSPPNPVVVWLSIEGNVINMVQGDRVRRSVLVGMDGDDTAYLCGTKTNGTAVCYAMGPDADVPLWSVEIDSENLHQCSGGAIDSDRLYVTLSDGLLVAFGE